MYIIVNNINRDEILEAIMLGKLTNFTVIIYEYTYFTNEFLDIIKGKEIYLIGGQYETHQLNVCSKVTIFLDENDTIPESNDKLTIIVQGFTREWMKHIADPQLHYMAKLLYNYRHCTFDFDSSAFVYGIDCIPEPTLWERMLKVINLNFINKCNEWGSPIMLLKRNIIARKYQDYHLATFRVNGMQIQIAIIESMRNDSPMDVQHLASASKVNIGITLYPLSELNKTYVTLYVHEQHLNQQFNASFLAKNIFGGHGTKSFATGYHPGIHTVESFCHGPMSAYQDHWLHATYIPKKPIHDTSSIFCSDI